MLLGDGTPDSPCPSATILVLRDALGGLEVLLLKRHDLSDVLGGAYVFPGGKVEAADDAFSGGLDREERELHEALGEPAIDPSDAAALYVAAIREAFEEAGVLFAPVTGERSRTALAHMRGGATFTETMHALGVRPATAMLVPWTRWVTPRNSLRARKHFDARFFVASLPHGQEPAHDDHETTELVWLAPSEALRQYWDGRIELVPPQIMSLAHLARFARVDEVLTYARVRKPPRIQPETFQEDGLQMVCYPGDERHSVRIAAMPGPTRLCLRNDRFEPLGGFPDLLGRDG